MIKRMGIGVLADVLSEREVIRELSVEWIDEEDSVEKYYRMVGKVRGIGSRMEIRVKKRTGKERI